VDETEHDLDVLFAEAERRARATRGGEAADYFAVRAANDALRERGQKLLNETFTALAARANRAGAGITLSTTDAHRFRVGNSTMVGTRLVLARGVRSLTVEVGWPRLPRDGVVRGSALACARVSHFGGGATDDLLLALDAEGTPLWLVAEKTGARTELSDEHLRRHFAKLLA
jgi:hypothetical protein